MPIYEYKCKACNREFEYQQRMADPEKTECEACGESALERLISRTAFQLKGSGWYKDLYSSSKPESKSTDAAAKTDGGTKADTASTPSTSDAGSSSKSSDSAGSSSGGGSSGGSSSGGTSTGSGSGSSGTSGGSSGTKAAASAK
jgi:putative FmdB family regulatory protein